MTAVTESRYRTPAACPTCASALAMDSVGSVYCTVHGTKDVPSIDEIRRDVTDGFVVERHPYNGVLYVVPSGDGPDPRDVEALTALFDLMAEFPSNEQRARYLLSSNWMRERGAAAATQNAVSLAVTRDRLQRSQ